MKRVLVTGASGFIGGHILRALLDDGVSVIAQYRNPRWRESFYHKRPGLVDFAQGDLRDRSFAHRIASGADAIVHAAAMVSMTGSKKEFNEVNVVATSTLLTEAQDGPCSHFIYLSSISTQGFGNHEDSDESGPYYKLISDYQRTKRAAELRVLSIDPERLPWTVIRPGLVYGPGDTTTLAPVFQLIEAGKLPLLDGFQVYNCPVFVEDLADAVLLSLKNPDAAGHIFNITSGEKVLLRDAVDYIADLMGKPRPRTNLPGWVARTAAPVLELIYRFPFLQGDPTISRYLAAELSGNFHFVPSKAGNILGFSPKTGWRDGLAKAVEAFRIDSAQLTP